MRRGRAPDHTGPVRRRWIRSTFGFPPSLSQRARLIVRATNARFAAAQLPFASADTTAVDPGSRAPALRPYKCRPPPRPSSSSHSTTPQPLNTPPPHPRVSSKPSSTMARTKQTARKSLPLSLLPACASHGGRRIAAAAALSLASARRITTPLTMLHRQVHWWQGPS